MCVFIAGSNVLSTEVVDSSKIMSKRRFCFPTPITFTELSSDFSIYIQVFDLMIPNQAVKSSKGGFLTPKKGKQKNTNSPSVQSGNSNTQAPNFVSLGTLSITKTNWRKAMFSLSQASQQNNPLEGIVQVTMTMKAKHNFEEKSFLNFYEEQTGYWRSRWCILKDNVIFLWKFPEDVETKPPINVINLRQCINPNVSIVPFDVCARKNTFMLILAKPEDDDDQPTSAKLVHTRCVFITCFQQSTSFIYN